MLHPSGMKGRTEHPQPPCWCAGCYDELSFRLARNYDEKTLTTWMAVHPHSYRSGVLHAPLDEYPRFPTLSPLPSATLHVRLRVEMSGVRVNGAMTCDTVDTAVSHLSFVTRLWRGRPIQVELDGWGSKHTMGTLLQAMEQSRMQASSLSVPDVCSLIQEGGTLPQCISSVTSLELLGPSPLTARLAGVEKLARLQVLKASLQQLHSLLPLSSLNFLQDVDVSDSKIRNKDVEVLSQCPRLRSLTMNRCRGVTDISSLSANSTSVLRTLLFSGCSQLQRASGVWELPSLSIIDFAEASVGITEGVLSSLRRATDVALDFTRLPITSPPTELDEVLLPCVTRLSLCGAVCVSQSVEWLCRLSFISQLYVDRTNATHDTMVKVASACRCLQLVSAVHCEALMSALEWARQLPLLSLLHLSRRSIIDGEASRELEEARVLLAQ